VQVRVTRSALSGRVSSTTSGSTAPASGTGKDVSKDAGAAATEPGDAAKVTPTVKGLRGRAGKADRADKAGPTGPADADAAERTTQE
jgi:hypothetical protein